MISFSVLASGSRANCVYVATAKARVLVDCGLSAKQVELRLAQLSVAPDTITAIVLTHEHSDHVAGLRVFANRYGVQVYVNRKTYDASPEVQSVCPDRLRFFDSGLPFMVADLECDPFSISHDAEDPVAFRLSCSDSRGETRVLGVVTDLGQVTELVRERTRGLDAVVLESNHDPVMLQECDYPWSIKQRIGGRSGHLSNACAGELLGKISSGAKALQVAVAAHISENSNRPELALEGMRSGWKNAGTGIEPAFEAAGPFRPTALYQIV